MDLKPLTQLTANRKAPEGLLAALAVRDNKRASADAGLQLVNEARSYGLEMRDFLRLAVDPMAAEKPELYEGLNGYEAALKFLNLPVGNDYDSGVVLDLASDTFEYSPGTRALFPEVVDDVVRFASRQVDYENLESLIASTRTINGVEMISTVVNDENPEDYKVFGPVSEFGRFRIGSIKTSETRVKMWKIGGGYRTSYEFQRRSRLDLLTPYANRMQRELNLSKVGLATDLLINGDTVNVPANVVPQSSFDNLHGAGVAEKGRIAYKNLLQWFVARAKAGVPIDTVVGNWDAYLDWLFLFALPTANATTRTDAENLAATGFRIGGVPILNGQINFVLSTTMPAGQLLGFRKGETLEQLIEAGSLISESERAVQTQSITYVKSEVSGFRLVFGDTREIYDYTK
ncbi:hypothetical protein ASG32_07995 [Methylobacterium sp. Leaf361]|uniref:hypothetical protein n=1 Tax=Methylobacterium sp. Leaf361 TaxID=1736352 RepID=UPI0006FEE848|nr:hypothetical protein [Methylobacterium sp. Leaf361]KQS75028.1 hypothetical protein ASG32_07995 [Methylobacterium sp. Leaf361]